MATQAQYTPNALMVITSCPADSAHGQMMLRERMTNEQSWCGVWYDCIHCHSSELLPSQALLAHNAKLSARAALAKATQA